MVTYTEIDMGPTKIEIARR